jgi:regulator of cell morphogenesis and NO signaling
MDTTAAIALYDLTTAADVAAAILPILDGLAPLEAVELSIARAGAAAALKALQSSRKGLFEWSVLGDGTPLRIQLLRRNAAPGALRGVNEALAWDHDRLEGIEAAAFDARQAGEYEKARDLYASFVTGLRRHIAFEEALLFPTFEKRLGFPSHAGPTAVMRFEHEQIVALLTRLAIEIAVPGSAAERTRAQLQDVLGEHNLKEEQIVYPNTDDALGPDEADALVASIQSF